MSLSTMLRIGNRKLPAPRREAALLGIFTIFLQAALFAWHHHPLPLSSRGDAVVLAAAPAGGQPAPVLTDDDCQICFALSHHSAAPVDFVGAPMSGPLRLHLPPVETVWAPLRSYVLFRSRAPPRV